MHVYILLSKPFPIFSTINPKYKQMKFYFKLPERFLQRRETACYESYVQEVLPVSYEWINKQLVVSARPHRHQVSCLDCHVVQTDFLKMSNKQVHSTWLEDNCQKIILSMDMAWEILEHCRWKFYKLGAPWVFLSVFLCCASNNRNQAYSASVKHRDRLYRTCTVFWSQPVIIFLNHKMAWSGLDSTHYNWCHNSLYRSQNGCFWNLPAVRFCEACHIYKKLWVVLARDTFEVNEVTVLWP